MRPVAAVALFLAMPLLAAGDKPVVVKLGKLSAPAPAGWKSERPANRLRAYQFQLPCEKGGPGHAELVVMESGKASKEFPRWKAGFVPPEGRTVDDISKVRKIDAPKGATIDLLDVTGTWRYKAAPFDPKSKEELKDDYRVVWVVVADDEGTNQLRLSGPRETVGKYYPGLEKFLKSLK